MKAKPKVILSLFDYTGYAVKPWADAGYTCYCYDILHPVQGKKEGNIYFQYADLDIRKEWEDIILQHVDEDVILILSWPPCDDLSVSGAKHFESKLRKDPKVQIRAVERAVNSKRLADALDSKYVIENPISMLSTLWQKPNAYINPCDYGGYLSEDDEHPDYPDIIPSQDAYTKKTSLWYGNGFLLPTPKPVTPIVLERVTKSGKTIKGSPQFMKLGGKSFRTKTIRNATPRGFAQAIYEENK